MLFLNLKLNDEVFVILVDYITYKLKYLRYIIILKIQNNATFLKQIIEQFLLSNLKLQMGIIDIEISDKQICLKKDFH